MQSVKILYYCHGNDSDRLNNSITAGDIVSSAKTLQLTSLVQTNQNVPRLQTGIKDEDYRYEIES